MRVFTQMAVLGATALAVTGMASAKTTPKLPAGMAVRTGGFFEHDLGSGLPWASFGLDANLKLPDQDPEGQIVSVDYLQRGKDNNVLGITASKRWSPKPSTSTVGRLLQPYYGLGFGLYRLQVGGSSRVGPGFKLSAGVAARNGILLEADYHLPVAGRVGGLHGRGVDLMMGIRF